MNKCMRCGDKLQHNYLVTVFRVTKEKRERLVVCSKCRDIINKMDKEVRIDKEVKIDKEAKKDKEAKIDKEAKV